MKNLYHKGQNKESSEIPKKSLGQNFLQSQAVLEEILSAGELKPNDWVVEIGPGKGILTKALVESAGRIVALEKDEVLAEKLQQEEWFKNNPEKIHLFLADALEFNFSDFFQKEKIEKYKLIANIPYYITGKLLRIFQELTCRPELAVLLVQKEVAERFCAPAGKKSLLSIAGEYFGQAQIVAEVSRENFFPVPQVDSAILKIVFKAEKELAHSDQAERKNFFRLVKIGFAARRKMLQNNLRVQYSKELIAQAFEKAGLDLKIRAQDLELRDWLALEKFFGA